MKHFAYMFFLGTLLLACESENEEELFPPVTPQLGVVMDSTTASTVSFSADIQPLIRANCATPGCHRANLQSPTLETYTQIEASKTRIKARVDQGTMPPSGPLVQTDKDKITTWINEGALNN